MLFFISKCSALRKICDRTLLEHSEGHTLFGRDGFFHQLKQDLVNGILEGEMEHHIGYKKHDKSPKQVTNRRNGYSTK
ncbi:MAG: transposase, partial [Rhizobiales bacterium]|nr:transposase [Hyphomicrobiales bacterium]